MLASAGIRVSSFAVSLLLHAALLLTLAERAVVDLTLPAPPLVVSIVEASRRSEGPGLPSPQLLAAAPPAAVETPPPVEDARVDIPPPPEPEPAEKEPEPVVEPKPKPKPKPAPVERAAPKKADKPAPVVSARATPAPSASAPIGAMSGDGAVASRGDAAAGSAPSWAPAARVRYEELLQAWFQRHKEYPAIAKRRGIQGSGSLRIRIDRKGRVLERSLKSSTGASMLDEAALDIVRRASPFPAIPEDYPDPSFEFVIPVEYRLH